MPARHPRNPPNIDARLTEQIREIAASLQPAVIDLACEISTIPAPTNDEIVRSRMVSAKLIELGAVDLSTDDIGDVVARIPGKQRNPALLLAAHLDTVFPRDTPLNIVRSNGRIAGPGIGDNSLGVASVLMLPELFRILGVVPEVDILLTGNVGEEGLGNLRGIRAVMDQYPAIGAVIAIEGHNLGRVTHVAVGSRRLRVRVSGPGGHSWGDYGNPSAIHVAAELVSELGQLSMPTTPKTTLNIGTFNGGISVNTIAPDASFVVDLRSVEEASLRRLTQRVDAVLNSPRRGVSVSVEVLGVRPAGLVLPSSPIVRLAIETLESMGITPTGDASSTDANIAISRGVPAICIGLTTGGNVHRVDEYIDLSPIATGLSQLASLSLAVARQLASGTIAPVGATLRS